MTGNVDERAVLTSHHFLGQCFHITLNNGVEAFYLNGEFITDADPADGVVSLLALSRSIARASGCELKCYVLPEPDDEEWAWNDVVDAIVQRRQSSPESLHSTLAPEHPTAPRGLLARLLASRK
ncbi:hypothetical protein ACCY16_17345 [Candidatus Pantoea formicae]|uniref:hypothetical protein n=1 Tax=Candidatus Pantoea formicae TaxID=2608355 RepID=UPI003ED90F79